MHDNYTLIDWLEIERIFKYLKGTKHLGLIFRGNEIDLIAYSDASLGQSMEYGKSISGYLINSLEVRILW